MSRPVKIIRNIALGLVGLILLVVVAGLVIVQTEWFRQFVRQKIIASTEEATGGKVELGSFDFDVSHLRAVVTNFVIHGKEPASAAPFVRVDRTEVDLRLFTSLKHLVDITYLGLQHPQVNVITFPDGTTSIPSPKESKPSGKSPLETVVDLAIGRFDLANGLINFNDQKQDLNLRGNNLRALLNWNVTRQSYEGQLSLEPLYVVSGRNTPVNFKVELPVVLARDRIDVRNASITTPQSSLQINASVENMNSPRTSAHINGHIALADLKNAGNLPLTLSATNVPTSIDLDANATVASDTIQVTGLRASLGRSSIEASGTLKDPKGNGSLQVKSDLALGELGRLANLSAKPDGEVLLNATAKIDPANNYQADGNIEARNISISQNQQQIRGIHLVSAVHADPHDINLKGLRLSALGGEFDGNASLQDQARYHLDGNLRNFDIHQLLQQLAPKQAIPYDGVISGAVDVTGDTKTPGVQSLVATTHLNIAPGRRGIPVSGRLNADYRGSNDQIAVQNSFLALPHTRLNVSGSVGRRLDISLTSTDLNDLLAAASMAGSKAPVTLNRGQASFNGAVTGSVAAPRVQGHLAMDRFSVEGRQFNSVAADVAASKSQAAISNGSLVRSPMQASFDAQVGLRNWSATPNQPLRANVALRNGDLADVMVLAGEQPAGYSGALSADAHINGTVGNPQGSATIQGSNGTIDGQPFDQLNAQVNLADQLVTVPAAYITSGPSRIDLNAEFRHPRDSFSTGHVRAHVQSNQVNLAQVTPLQKQVPNTAGTVQMNADVTGDMGKTYALSSVNGNVALRSLRIRGQNYGDLTANASTSGQTVTYRVNSDFAGSTLRVNGNTQLATDYPTTLDASIQNLQVAPILTLAQSDIPAKGTLSGTAHLSGTLANPQGNADVDLSNAVIYDEPLDHLRTRVTYLANSIDVPQFEVVAGPSRIDLSAHFDHPPSNFQAGSLKFRVNSSRIDLARIRNLQKLRPGLGGGLQLSADGSAKLQAAAPRVLLTGLNANVAARSISAQGKNFGDLTLTANEATAGRVNFALNSDLAGSSINASGNAQLTGGYPVDAQLSFKNVTWTRLQPLIGATNGEPPAFEGAIDGQVTVNGPVMNTSQLRGNLNLSRLAVTSIPTPGSPTKPVSLQNDGPIVIALDNGNVRLQSVKFAGPKTNIQATGTASLPAQTLNVSVNGNADLSMLQNFDRDVESSGSVVLATTVHGTFQQPLVNGTLDLRSAGLHYSTVANGLSNANGTIVFNGSSANIRNLSAETGGGTITATGFVGYSGTLRFSLAAKAAKTRILIQQGVSIITDADIHLTGTQEHSLVSGTVTIEGLNYLPQSDIGSMLSRAAPPVQAPTAPSPLLDNMRLDIRVRTAPALAVQAAMAQNLQADADLRVRGTAAQPGVLGRVNISQGQLVFFSSTYTVNSGSIGFYNPVRIDPVLDISLETQAKGVDVVLHVTGPIDNMKLSYTSDPPLQFQEIVSLLAAGKTPTSDPTLLANQPAEPQQSFQQMGESALVSKALADPVSSRLQRVFGVSQLKIDPSFTAGSQIPQARLTLQQQVSSNVTFTYVSALNDPNTTVIRVEWAFNPQWSAVANRDENGIFSLNFFYKKQFR